MNRTFGLVMITALLGLSAQADAHTLRHQCKRITNDDVVCRAFTSDGELARGVEIQLLATSDYRVLTKGKTDVSCRWSGLIREREERIGGEARMTRKRNGRADVRPLCFSLCTTRRWGTLPY